MTDSLHDLVPEWIREIDPYRPGKPIEEVERELKIHAIKLASNENPLGPSPLAVAAVQKFVVESHRYPDGGAFYLREKIAARHRVPMESVFLGDGSAELIDVAARLLLRPGDDGVTSDGTFPLYWIAIRAAGGKIIRVPLREYRYDLDAIAAAVTPRTRIIYLANPNNPTGTIFSQAEFDAFYERVTRASRALIVLDEAYIDFVAPDLALHSMARAGRVPNLLVLRTFSKVYGLAGIRIGYGVGPADLLGEMNKLRTPFNTANVAQAAALAALDDTAHVQRSIAANLAERTALCARLRQMGVEFVESHANFVLIRTGRAGREVSEALLERGVIVRPMAWMGLPECIRVTVGLPEENEKFLAALAQVLSMAAP